MRHKQYDNNSGRGGSSGFSSRTATFGGAAFGHFSPKRKMIMIGVVAVLWVGAAVALFLRSFTNVGETAEIAKPVEQPVVVEQTSEQPQVEMVDVLVPVKSIEAGTQLVATDFVKVARPRSVVSNGVITSFDQISGSYAKTLIPVNQPIVRDHLVQDAPSNAVVSNIPNGHRAVTIDVNATSSVEGWARAGARVDVHWIADLLGERTVRVLVENAKVLSAERQVDPKANPSSAIPTTVTLLVTDKDAQKISLAATAGTLVMHLRGQNDFNVSQNAGTLTLRDILGGKSVGPDDRAVEGVLKIKERDGTTKELAIVDGSVVKQE